MFGRLSDGFGKAIRKLSGKGSISEANVREAMEEVRTALLEADVQYDVVNDFCEQVTQDALGTEVLKSLEPARLGELIVLHATPACVELGSKPSDGGLRFFQLGRACGSAALVLERLRLQLGVLCGPRRLRTLGRAHRSSCNAGRRLACSAPRRATRTLQRVTISAERLVERRSHLTG